MTTTAKKAKRSRFLVTGFFLAGLALVFASNTGDTWALYSDSVNVLAEPAAEVEIMSGELNLNVLGAPTWLDVSPDVPGTPTVIDPDTFTAMRGDVFQVEQTLEAEIIGDNNWVDVRVTAPALTGPLTADINAVYTLLENSVPVPGVENIPLGRDPVKTSGVHASTVYTLRVTFTYDLGSADAAAQPVGVSMPEISVRMMQVRP